MRDGSLPTWHSTGKDRGDLKPLPTCSIFPYPCRAESRGYVLEMNYHQATKHDEGFCLQKLVLVGCFCLYFVCLFVCFSNYLFTVTLRPGPSCWGGGCWAPRAAAPSGSPTHLTWVRKQTWKALAFSPKSEMLTCPATYAVPLPFFLNGVIEHGTSFACKLRWHL